MQDKYDYTLTIEDCELKQIYYSKNKKEYILFKLSNIMVGLIKYYSEIIEDTGTVTKYVGTNL